MVRIRRTFPVGLLIACVGCLALLACRLEAAEFYVSPQGNDAWSGTLAAANADGTDGPFATPQRATQAIRDAKSKAADGETLRVRFREGYYPLAERWTLGPEDSGAKDHPIVYEAYENEHPILSGGRKLGNWQVGDDGRWRTTLPEVAKGEWYFTQLFVNNQRRYRPRLPRQSYYTIAERIEAEKPLPGRGSDGFRFTDEEIRGDWHNLADVEVLPFHQWTMSRMPVRAVDAENHIVRFFELGRNSSNWGDFIEKRRYLIENVREALGEPGQWYLDRVSGELTYLPKAGETPETAEVIAPKLDTLLVLAGDLASGGTIEYVTFRGLDFAFSNYVTPREGKSWPQAETDLEASLMAVGARHVVFEQCVVRHMGQYALALEIGCQDNRIEACELFDLAGGGVKIGHVGNKHSWEESRQATEGAENEVSGNIVRDCTIAYAGRMHNAAIGVWIGLSSGNTVEHNDIYDMYYSGVSVGWTWGYSVSKAHHNRIFYNQIHTIGQGVLSDMGGVYTLGVSPGTQVSGNRIHDVTSFSYGGWGLYTDEGSSQIEMRDNVVYRCKTGGFFQHYGRDNVLANNIFVDGVSWQLQRTRSEPHRSFTFENNIVAWQNDSLLFDGKWGDPDHYLFKQNLYFRAGGKPIVFPGGRDLKKWQTEAKQDEDSIIADPKFVDWAHDDYNLAKDSPAFGVGFKAFDQLKAGRLTPAKRTANLPTPPAAFPTQGP